MNSAVLIVDDEPLIRETLGEILSGLGLVIFKAAETHEALEILKKRAHQIAILITDVRMPGAMDGLDLANIVQKSWPWIRVIVMSAHYETGPDRLPVNARYLCKPWQSYDMVETVRRAASEFQAMQLVSTH
jgi:YesN/AraC family two-component response regulator